jgi:hypothetical protein
MPRAGWSDSGGIVNRPSTSEARVTRRMSRGPGEPQSRLARLSTCTWAVSWPCSCTPSSWPGLPTRSRGSATRFWALVVESAYVALAGRRREIKYADYCLWTVFALGTLLVLTGVDSAVFLFQNYAPAIFFGTLGLMALVPLPLGRETFTYYYARRQTPRWQQNLPTFHSINRLMVAFWTLIFFTAALPAAAAPHDWRFTALYPNLLVFPN